MADESYLYHCLGRSRAFLSGCLSCLYAWMKDTVSKKSSPVCSVAYFQPPSICQLTSTGTSMHRASAKTRGEASCTLKVTNDLDCSMSFRKSRQSAFSCETMLPEAMKGCSSGSLVRSRPKISTVAFVSSISLIKLGLARVQLRAQSFHSPPWLL